MNNISHEDEFVFSMQRTAYMYASSKWFQLKTNLLVKGKERRGKRRPTIAMMWYMPGHVVLFLCGAYCILQTIGEILGL